MTALIHSQVKSLNALRINPMPSKPLRDARAVRVPSTGTVVAIDARGNIYSTQVASAARRNNYRDLGAGRIRSTIEGLVKLGALSAVAVREHQAIIKREAELGNRRASAESLLEDVRELGLKLTRSQLIKVELALGGGAVARAKIADKLGVDVLKGFK